MGALHIMSNIIGALYKEQHLGSIIQGATSFKPSIRNIMGTLYKQQHMGTLYKEQHMGTLYKEQHHGNLIQG
jgi:hypothetical protein